MPEVSFGSEKVGQNEFSQKYQAVSVHTMQ